MYISPQTLRAMGCDSTRAGEYAPLLSAAAARYEVNTKMRMAAFLAQVLHESSMFSATRENLNYSAERLMVVFPKYFKTTADAAAYGRRPEAIANRVYASRMGNGKESTGDGFKYRGRGLIQLTGKNNYKACGESIKVDLLNNPDWAATPEGAVETAFWFWGQNKLNTVADKGSVESVTRVVNGGVIGLQHRQQLYEKALAALN